MLVAGQADNGQLQLYALPSGKQLDVVRAHEAAVLDVEFSRDGRRVATGAVDGLAKTWDVAHEKLREALTLRGHTNPVGSVSFVWSVDSGAQILQLGHDAQTDAPDRAVIGVDVSSDGSRIATASADGRARIFDAKTGRQLVVISGRHCVGRYLCRVNRAVFSPDGRRLATTGQDATVRVFDAATGRQLRVLRGHAPGGLGTYPVAWTPDGARLLSMATDGTRIWDARTGRQLLALPPSGGPGWHAAWSPDGAQVLTESGVGPVVWDASSGERLRTLETSAASADMQFSRDGSPLAITTLDERGYAIRIWSWPAGVETLNIRDSGVRIALSPDGLLVATVRSRQPVPFVHVWTLDPERLLRIARTRVTRSLTEEECRRYLQHPCPEGR
jgi:WD40 repeat protein